MRSDQSLRCRCINILVQRLVFKIILILGHVWTRESLASGHSRPLRHTMVLFFVRILSFRIYQERIPAFVISLLSSLLTVHRCTVLVLKRLSPSEDVCVKDVIGSVPSLLEIMQV